MQRVRIGSGVAVVADAAGATGTAANRTPCNNQWTTVVAALVVDAAGDRTESAREATQAIAAEKDDACAGHKGNGNACKRCYNIRVGQIHSQTRTGVGGVRGVTRGRLRCAFRPRPSRTRRRDRAAED